MVGGAVGERLSGRSAAGLKTPARARGTPGGCRYCQPRFALDRADQPRQSRRLVSTATLSFTAPLETSRLAPSPLLTLPGPVPV